MGSEGPGDRVFVVMPAKSLPSRRGGAGAIARFRSACARNERRAPPRPLPGPADRGATPTTGSARGAAPASLSSSLSLRAEGHPWLHPGAPHGVKGIARGAWAIDIAPSRLNRDARAINLADTRYARAGPAPGEDGAGIPRASCASCASWIPTGAGMTALGNRPLRLWARLRTALPTHLTARGSSCPAPIG